MASLPHTIGKYEILEEIARGAYGIVFKAQDIELNRIVALKLLKDGNTANPQQIERFRREAKLSAKLNHNNIVKIYDAGTINQGGNAQCYIAMEFIEGTPLSTIIIDRNIASKQATLLVERIASALSYAHSEGVIHRDIKPANIIIRQDGTPIITDFGIAKRIESTTTLTQTGELLGTPSYMPPEQISGNIKEVDERSDIYSLGALLCELLTFHPPFEGDNFLELSAKILNDDPIPLTKLNADIDKDLETICLKAMSKEKRNRYQTAEEMASDLRRFNEGKDILAKPPTISAKLIRTIRRHKMVTVIAVILAISLITFLLYRKVFVVPLEQVSAEFVTTLTIKTNPTDADVIMKGNNTTLKGMTPLVFENVKFGDYILTLKKMGYLDISVPITVERETNNTVNFRLYRKEEVPEDMVYVPTGEFLMGDPTLKGDNTLGLHKVFTKAFFIDKYEVTNAQYKTFIDATNHKPPKGWKNGIFPKGEDSHPVTDVTYEDAILYSKWAGKRLPTEEEWEKAARGIDGRIYPWGDEFKGGNTKLQSIGLFINFISPYGCYDMSGNAAEWTVSQDNLGYIRVKGGSYLDALELCTTYASSRFSKEKSSKSIGFRCVKDAPE